MAEWSLLPGLLDGTARQAFDMRRVARGTHQSHGTERVRQSDVGYRHSLSRKEREPPLSIPHRTINTLCP